MDAPGLASAALPQPRSSPGQRKSRSATPRPLRSRRVCASVCGPRAAGDAGGDRRSAAESCARTCSDRCSSARRSDSRGRGGGVPVKAPAPPIIYAHENILFAAPRDPWALYKLTPESYPGLPSPASTSSRSPSRRSRYRIEADFQILRVNRCLVGRGLRRGGAGDDEPPARGTPTCSSPISPSSPGAGGTQRRQAGGLSRRAAA